MGKLELVARRRDETDRRNVLVQRTVKGALYLDRLANLIGTTSKNL
jgi:DNA-binding MarR family transcriptional regulator